MVFRLHGENAGLGWELAVGFMMYWPLQSHVSEQAQQLAHALESLAQALHRSAVQSCRAPTQKIREGIHSHVTTMKPTKIMT